MTSPTNPRRAAVVGTGLIGASIGMALRARGWRVTGFDLDASRSQRALELGALDEIGSDPEAEIAFVATPASAAPSAANELLENSRAVVTDVAGVKSAVVASVDSPRFVGGHPMAGSEQDGPEGADGEMFEGATWVLTPVEGTDAAAYAQVSSVVASFGAEVIALDPEQHDSLVATISHVPHLAASTLMTVAGDRTEQHAVILRLAAGGFRDMTRIAAGHPGIWLDICFDNSKAIVRSLDRLLESLTEMRDAISNKDREAIFKALEDARMMRLNLPVSGPLPKEVMEMRIPVLDRPGVLAEVTTLAGHMNINISDLEIAHSVEGSRGVLLLLVEARRADELRDALIERGYHPSLSALT